MRYDKQYYNDWYSKNKKDLHFRGADDVILTGANFCTPSPTKKCVLFLNGRSDNIKQYVETYNDFVEELGCDVWTFDHRGQGFSSRLTEDSYKGHVNKYEDYAADIDTFYKKYIQPKRYREFYVACHSMAGPATCLWLIDNTDVQPDCVFMTAPFFGAIAPIPEWLGHPLAWLVCTFGFSKSLVPTVGRPSIGPFSSNRLTADEKRYEYMCELNRLDDETPNLVKPTNGWALASYRAMKRVRNEIKKLKDLNVYIFQAEEEQYVDNSYHFEYAPDSWEIVQLDKERHHLWQCTDKGRKTIFDIIKGFMG